MDTTEQDQTPRWVEAKYPVAVHINGYGDSLLTIPALRALARLFCGRLQLICGPGDRQNIFRDLELAGVHEASRTSNKGQLRLEGIDWRSLEGRCDLFMSLNPWCSADIREFQARCSPNSIGFFPSFDCHIRDDRTQHWADTVFRIPLLLRPNLRIDDYAFMPVLDSQWVESAHSLRAGLPSPIRLLAIHTETKVEKEWSLSNWKVLVDGFLCDHSNFVVIVLDRRDRALSKGPFRNRIVSVPGILSLHLALVGIADAFVGVDSCKLHAADLFGIPSVGLFGGGDSAVRFGLRFTHHSELIQDSNGVKSIDPITVRAALETVLASSNPGDEHAT